MYSPQSTMIYYHIRSYIKPLEYYTYLLAMSVVLMHDFEISDLATDLAIAVSSVNSIHCPKLLL